MAVAGWQIATPVGRSIGHASYAFDVTNDRKLSNFAEDIFFGKVTEKNGESAERGDPQTQYQVAVIEVLKGDVSGSIIVTQTGGTESDGTKFRMADDPVLMEAGEVYLFITREDKAKEWHHPGSGYSKIKLEVAEDATREEILRSEDANRLRVRFTEAIEAVKQSGRAFGFLGMASP